MGNKVLVADHGDYLLEEFDGEGKQSFHVN